MSAGDGDLTDGQRSFHDGREAFDAGDFALALQCFRRSIAAGQHFKAWEMAGQAQMELGDAQAAYGSLRRAFDLNSRSTKTGVLLAKCMRGLDMPVEQIQPVLDQVLAVNPTYGPANRLRDDLRRDRR